MKTRIKILKAGLKQFNKDGVEVVTTRHIAGALGISQGNLHYHFPNKDLIIEALYEAFIEEVIQASKYVPNDVFEKENVLLSMRENFDIMYTYRFLFRDNETVWRRIPKLKEQMLQLLAVKKKEIKEIISVYIDGNIFRSDITAEQIDSLVDQFIFNIGTWLNASEYLGVKEHRSEYFARFTFRQWFPYLKPEEMVKWEELLS